MTESEINGHFDGVRLTLVGGGDFIFSEMIKRREKTEGQLPSVTGRLKLSDFGVRVSPRLRFTKINDEEILYDSLNYTICRITKFVRHFIENCAQQRNLSEAMALSLAKVPIEKREEVEKETIMLSIILGKLKIFHFDVPHRKK